MGSTILALLGALGLAALVIGAFVGIVRTASEARNRQISKPSIVLAIVCLGILALAYSVFVPIFRSAKEAATRTTCISNLHQLGVALNMYMDANDDHLPRASTWCDAAHPWLGSYAFYRCPLLKDGKCGYSMNSLLSGVAGARIPDTGTQVMLFDSNGGWNSNGGSASLLFRHSGTANVGFVDSHVRSLRADKAAELRWTLPAEQGG